MIIRDLFPIIFVLPSFFLFGLSEKFNLNINEKKVSVPSSLPYVRPHTYSICRHIVFFCHCKSCSRVRFIQLCPVDRALMNFPIFYDAAGVAIVESQLLPFHLTLLFPFMLFPPALAYAHIHGGSGITKQRECACITNQPYSLLRGNYLIIAQNNYGE